jgi:hypothetical protein
MKDSLLWIRLFALLGCLLPAGVVWSFADGSIDDVLAEWGIMERPSFNTWSKFKATETSIWVSTTDSSRLVYDFKNGKIKAVATAATDKESELQLKYHVLQALLKTNTWKEVDISGVFVETIDDAVQAVGSMDVLVRELGGTIETELTLFLIDSHLSVRKERYRGVVEKYADEYRLSPGLIEAIIEAETYYNPQALSRTGSVGLMQIEPNIGAKYAVQQIWGDSRSIQEDDLRNPDMNIRLGCAYLRHLLDRYDFIDDAEARSMIVLMAYNLGPLDVDQRINPDPQITLNQAKFKFLTLPKYTQVYLNNINKLAFLW